MASKNSSELLSKLRSSLPIIEAETKPLTAVDHSARPPTLIENTVVAAASAKGTRAPKLSVSLYQRDIERLDTIKDFMKAQGFRNLSDSEALRLACRKVEIDGALIDIYRSMQGEDGRRKQE